MRYEYSGHLRNLVYAPDADLRETLDHVEFSAGDIARWHTQDDDADLEWQNIPVTRRETENGVILQGVFEDVRRIENLKPDDPSFWVPLRSAGVDDGRFPVDLRRYPIVELTYRCSSNRTRPAWMLHYPGGVHFDGLAPSTEWRRIARLIPFNGFPEQIDGITFRLYGVTRSTEFMEIQSVRFRAIAPGEQEALWKGMSVLEGSGGPRKYPLLDEFFPMGVFMDAGDAKDMAELMEISFRDYWRMALEDIARHHHNAVILEGMARLSGTEWREVLGLAQAYGLRIVAAHEWSEEEVARRGLGLVEEHIAPYADSEAVLGWSVVNEPAQHTFQMHMELRAMIEEADPNHPLAAIMREPNSFPLFAPHLAATGLSYFTSNAAWNLSELIKTHQPLSRGQQLWLAGPAFIYATDTPKWNTCPEIRLMLNLAFASGVRGWFAYSYHNAPIWMGGSCQRSLTGPFLTFSDIWAELGNRMERFSAMTPLFLKAVPGDPPFDAFDIRFTAHPRSRRPKDVPPVSVHWCQGPDFALLYVVSNDIVEMTPVNLRVTEGLPPGLAIYDITNFVRSRSWQPMVRDRHLEMFPGQCQVIMLAEPHVCDAWRDRIAQAIKEGDERQVSLYLGLARRYSLDISHVQSLMRDVGMTTPIDDIAKLREARETLTNVVYAAPEVCVPRSRLIQVSAGICGCDGTLCRLLGMGKVDLAHELGLKVIPLTRDMNKLFVRLRRGHGPQILHECEELCERTLALLATIREAI